MRGAGRGGGAAGSCSQRPAPHAGSEGTLPAEVTFVSAPSEEPESREPTAWRRDLERGVTLSAVFPSLHAAAIKSAGPRGEHGRGQRLGSAEFPSPVIHPVSASIFPCTCAPTCPSIRLSASTVTPALQQTPCGALAKCKPLRPAVPWGRSARLGRERQLQGPPGPTVHVLGPPEQRESRRLPPLTAEGARPESLHGRPGSGAAGDLWPHRPARDSQP